MNSETLTQLPAVFGRYVLTRRLSRGGMGEIFLGKVGEIQGFEKPIVIKKILPALSRDADFVQRFIEEAKIAINLSHVNIVPVYEVGKVEDEYFLAMQYVEGRDLRTLMTHARDQGVRMPPELCLFLVRELANGLAYAHRRKDQAGKPLNLVHCDISPPNVLVSFEGEVKVIDFGIARTAIQHAQEDESVGFGKFGYMAPEQLIRGGTIDRGTDLYSSGVVLYELLTGERLFNFPADVDYRHVVREVTGSRFLRPSERVPGLGDAFDELVLRALRTDPGERYASAEAFRDAVQAQLYAMNPTISADSLATFVHQIFPDAVDQDRQMLRVLAQTDLAVFRGAVEDATEHTVSFALGGVYSSRSAIAKESKLTPDVMGVARERGHGQRTGSPGGAESTRQLSADERVAAALLTAGTQTSDLMPSPWRGRGILILVSAVVALVAGVIFTFVAGTGRETGGAPRPPSKVALGTAVEGRGDLGMDAGTRRERARDGAAVATTSDADSGGMTTRGSNDAAATSAPRAHRHRPHSRCRRVRGKGSRRASRRRPKRSVSRAEVRRKFRKIKVLYKRFERAYGGRLKDEWQRILFGLTYRKIESAALDRMLDGLRRKMVAIRRGS